MEKSTEVDLARAFRARLDSHGYGLQYAVAAAVDRENRSNQTYWKVASVEFPVATDKPTRADIVLKHRGRSIYLICECKRADPAVANWCFASAPLFDGIGPNDVVGEVIMSSTSGPVQARGGAVGTVPHVFDVGLELRTGARGDGSSPGRGEIEDAFTQVVRATNGVAEQLATNPSLLVIHDPTVLLPVVITTAALYSTTDRLDAASLQDGRIPGTPSSLAEHPWLAVRYRSTPSLKHSLVSTGKYRALRDLVVQNYLRTVFVVRADALFEFLEWAETGITQQWPTD